MIKVTLVGNDILYIPSNAIAAVRQGSAPDQCTLLVKGVTAAFNVDHPASEVTALYEASTGEGSAQDAQDVVDNSAP